ncbi:hypothetical protein TYRP_020132 [Tyrophagus putrescentiae]|nr:hypothetical protein TYRP_020132 [Tyrophagus putrescentiae]
MSRNKSNLIRSAGTPQGVRVPLESTFSTPSTTIPLMSPALPSLALNQQNVTIITNPQNISPIPTIDTPISATLSQMPKGHLIYLCENCKKPFNYLSELCKHDRIKHSKAQPYKCKLCPKYKGFLKGYVTEHIRREHQNKLKPNVHPNTFVEEDKVFLSNEKAKLMKQRKKIMTVSKNQQAQQKIEFENSEHFNENDSNETEESDSQQTQTETATQESNTEQLEIDFEGTSFTVTVDGVLAELLEASATSSQLAKIIFICEHCHCSGFPDWTALCQHIRGRHSKVKPFRCKFPNCSVEEKLKCVLERHVVNEHKQSKPNVIKSFIFTNQQKIDCENKKLKNWLSSKTYRKLVKEIEQSAQRIIAEKKSKT